MRLDEVLLSEYPGYPSVLGGKEPPSSRIANAPNRRRKGSLHNSNCHLSHSWSLFGFSVAKSILRFASSTFFDTLDHYRHLLVFLLLPLSPSHISSQKLQ